MKDDKILPCEHFYIVYLMFLGYLLMFYRT